MLFLFKILFWTWATFLLLMLKMGNIFLVNGVEGNKLKTRPEKKNPEHFRCHYAA